MPDDTSPGTGATPNPGTGATPNAPSGATPQAATPTVEELLRKIADLEHTHGNAKEELDRHRKKLSGYEKKEAEEIAARKAAEEAQLGELEREKKYREEASQKAQRYQQRLVMAEVKLAAQAKGIIDPDLAALAIQGSLEYDDDGMPTNLEKALDTLIKNKPYLAPVKSEPQAQTTPAQTASAPVIATPTIPAMNPGRSNIPAPGSNPPGRIPRLSDRGVFVPPGTPSKYQP